MLDETLELESQLRSMTNRRITLESQLNDAQTEIKRINRSKEAMELDVRKKRKEIARIKVELDQLEQQNKQWDQKLFEWEQQVSYTKKQLDKLVAETKEIKLKLHELI